MLPLSTCLAERKAYPTLTTHSTDQDWEKFVDTARYNVMINSKCYQMQPLVETRQPLKLASSSQYFSTLPENRRAERLSELALAIWMPKKGKTDAAHCAKVGVILLVGVCLVELFSRRLVMVSWVLGNLLGAFYLRTHMGREVEKNVSEDITPFLNPTDGTTEVPQNLVRNTNEWQTGLIGVALSLITVALRFERTVSLTTLIGGAVLVADSLSWSYLPDNPQPSFATRLSKLIV